MDYKDVRDLVPKINAPADFQKFAGCCMSAHFGTPLTGLIIPSMITSKPAIDDHPKTGQRSERSRQGSFSLLPPGRASPFLFSNCVGRTLAHGRDAVSDQA